MRTKNVKKMGLFDLFKRKNMESEIKEYLEKGAIVLDVRTQMEWDYYRIQGRNK